MRPDDVIRDLCSEQMLYWRQHPVAYEAHLSDLDKLHTDYDELFLYEFTGSQVRLVSKTPTKNGAPLAEIFTTRAAKYLELFQLTLNVFQLEVHGALGMSMQDYPSFDTAITPIFAFQKLVDAPSILLPDIDALWHAFYTNRFEDTLCYRDKADEAVFVGSTTGSAHTVQSVVALENQRLRSAVFFRDIESVDFWLPNVVQCVDADAEAHIRALDVGFFSLGFDKQFQRKFLISMDGNGATCSRVAISLKSNSVLLKYSSIHKLYYFSALRAGAHYLPIAKDQDVLQAIAAEVELPGAFASIAAAGKEFFHDILGPGPALAYTAQLLSAYFAVFQRDTTQAAPSAQIAKPFATFAIAHVAQLGDQTYVNDWIGIPGSGKSIEGMAINLFYHLQPIPFEFKLWRALGNASRWTRPGRFSGTRGSGEASQGFSLRLSKEAEQKFACLYECRFVDGEVVGPVSCGSKCVSPSGAALEAVRVRLIPKL
jgi:hypothetical protein